MREKILIIVGFTIVFAGAGVIAGLAADGHTVNGFPGAFYVQAALAAVALGIFVVWHYGSRYIHTMHEDYLKHSFPSQPWMWRRDWSHRVSVVSKSTKNVTAWLATSWNLGVTPLAIGAMSGFSKVQPGFYVCGLAIAGGVGLCGYALYRVWFRIRLDHPPLRLHTNPGRLGGVFECTLSAPGLSDGMRWTSELVCIYSRIESVKVQSKFFVQRLNEEIWKTGFMPLVARSPRGAVLALRFLTPKDVPLSGSYKQGECRWVVRVQGRNRGGVVCFSHEYDVPMFFQGAQRMGVSKNAPIVQDEQELQLERLAVAADPTGSRHPLGTSTPCAVEYAPQVDVPAMLNALKENGIRFTKGGVIYADALWNQKALIGLHNTINKICYCALAGALSIMVVLMMFGQWLWTAPLAIIAILAVTVFAIALTYRNHRYSIIFNNEGITRRSHVFSRKWEKTIPWSKIQSVVWKSWGQCAGSRTTTNYRQLIINPDDRETRLVLSPVIGDHDAVEAMAKLLDSITRRVTRGRRKS